MYTRCIENAFRTNFLCNFECVHCTILIADHSVKGTLRDQPGYPSVEDPVRLILNWPNQRFRQTSRKEPISYGGHHIEARQVQRQINLIIKREFLKQPLENAPELSHGDGHTGRVASKPSSLLKR